MKQGIRSFALLSAFAVTSLVFGGCINTNSVATATPARACKLTGSEKYTFQVDGVFMGAFEDYSIQNDVVTFKNGIIPPSAFLKAWLDFNRARPLLTEKHDVVLFEIKPDGKIGSAVKEFDGSFLLNVDGTPSGDKPTCLIVDTLTLRADAVLMPTGVITNFR